MPDLLRAGLDLELDADAARDAVLDALYSLNIARFREPWMDQAKCRGHSELMYFTRGEDPEPARALCAQCPVIGACRDWGDRTEPGAPVGLLGGESARTRTKRRRSERRVASEAAA